MPEPFNPITYNFAIQRVASPSAATMLGINRHEDYKDAKAVRIERVIVVEQGTVNGKATLDIQLVDADGNKFVAMTTAALMGTVARIAGAAK